MRVASGIADLRSAGPYAAIREAIAASGREHFRVVHFSVQGNHLHFVAEAHDADALSRGARALAIRIARATNRATNRRGRVFDDRFHARALRTPREVRLGILYVLMNHKKHLRHGFGPLIDRLSSGPWFEGWRETPPIAPEPSPIPRPRTWLLRIGWLRGGGKLSVHDAPRQS